MTDTDNLQEINQALKSLTQKLDDLGNDDMDVVVSDDKVVVEFEDGIKFIINRQSAAGQIWVAEPGGGWHFDLKDGKWICSKRGVELFDSLSTLMTQKTGTEVRL